MRRAKAIIKDSCGMRIEAIWPLREDTMVDVRDVAQGILDLTSDPDASWSSVYVRIDDA